jgi:hypothetical protein
MRTPDPVPADPDSSSKRSHAHDFDLRRRGNCGDYFDLRRRRGIVMNDDHFPLRGGGGASIQKEGDRHCGRGKITEQIFRRVHI